MGPGPVLESPRYNQHVKIVSRVELGSVALIYRPNEATLKRSDTRNVNPQRGPKYVMPEINPIKIPI